MPLHEYLEQKRRDNIEKLNASGACHICGSNSRNSKGFNHFVDNEEKIAKYGNEHSMVKAPDLAAMKTCACWGQSPDDPDYWPYSVSISNIYFCNCFFCDISCALTSHNHYILFINFIHYTVVYNQKSYQPLYYMH